MCEFENTQTKENTRFDNGLIWTKDEEEASGIFSHHEYEDFCYLGNYLDVTCP